MVLVLGVVGRAAGDAVGFPRVPSWKLVLEALLLAPGAASRKIAASARP